MKPAVVPAPRRAQARDTFIRALAEHSGAISDLRAWRLSPSAYDSEEVLRDCVRRGGRNHIFGGYGDEWFSGEEIEQLAGEERLRAARTWSQQWHLEAAWLQRWATYALLRWDVARACSRPDCLGGCRVMQGDDDTRALDLVLTNAIMLSIVEEHHPEFCEVDVENLNDLDNSDIGIDDPLAPWQRPVVPPLAGPHPARETKQQYLARALRAWEAAHKALTDEGVSVTERRSLVLHCEWFVRYQVLHQSASAILKNRADPSALYHAVHKLAVLIELPVRS